MERAKASCGLSAPGGGVYQMKLERVNVAESSEVGGAEMLQVEQHWLKRERTLSCGTHIQAISGAPLLFQKALALSPVNRRLLACQVHVRERIDAVVFSRVYKSIFLMQEEATGTQCSIDVLSMPRSGKLLGLLLFALITSSRFPTRDKDSGG